MPRPRKDAKLPHITRRERARSGPAYDVQVPLTGGGRLSKTFSERTEAIAWRDEQLVLLHRGEATPQTTLTVGALLMRWLEDEAASRVRPSTLADYADTVRVHLLPRLGIVRADRLTASHVHAMLADMERAGVGCRTRQLALLRLKQTLAWASDIELLRRSVAEKISPPRCPPSEKRALTPSEQRDFLAAAEHDVLWPLWRVYLMTGLRRGEGLGLRWQDVDLGAGLIHVRQNVVLVKGQDGVIRPAIHEPKSPAARRSLDLDVQTVVEIRALHDRRQQAQHADVHGKRHRRSGLVFCTHVGTPLNPNNVIRNLTRIKEACGLGPDITIHSLRHTHATDCIEGGMDWLAVAARLGHADPSVTHDVYGHYRPGRERQIVDRLARALAGDALPTTPQLPDRLPLDPDRTHDPSLG
jgi:integrase